ncbi:hypothetical protein V1517DRAFT_354791 [Lipomyces orientalis]|uniref:Uncharacterized protein n=1 Tax=Lipomyces orientalis TaxID=1233043 RepID=A0ACC3TFN9_9ASCO
MPYQQLQLDANAPIDGLLVFFYSRVIKYGYNLHAATRRLKARLRTAVRERTIFETTRQDRDVRDVISGSTYAPTESSYRVRRIRWRSPAVLDEDDAESSGRSSEPAGGPASCSPGASHDDTPVCSPTSSLRQRIRDLRKSAHSTGSTVTTTEKSRATGTSTKKRRHRRCRSLLSMLSFRTWSFLFRDSILGYKPEEYEAFLKGTSADDYRQQAIQIYTTMPLEMQLDNKTIKRKSFKRRLLRI